VKAKIEAARQTARQKPDTQKQSRLGDRIIRGLEQAVSWSQGNTGGARTTIIQVPEIDIRKVRKRMGLSQGLFAAKFGFPPATLRNWEQGRSRPDASTRVLLAVIARHPEAVEDVLKKTG
jgi:putative transcriptional regulator